MEILQVSGIEKKLMGKPVLRKVSFGVNAGEIYGFLGPNGAGKTTTMKSILGFIHPEAGKISIFGKDQLDIESKKKIGFMPENTYLYKHLTGREFLLFNAKFFGYKEIDGVKKITSLLEKVGLGSAGDKKLSEYSKGMLQRVGLAQAILNDPKLVFLDEPMSGLDPIGRRMVKDLILELKAKGTTVFFNTHILADVESICDRVSIIHNGSIIVEGKKVSSISGGLEDFFINNIQKHS